MLAPTPRLATTCAALASTYALNRIHSKLLCAPPGPPTHTRATNVDWASMEHYEVRVASLARTQASKLAPTARHGKHMRGTCKQVCAHSDSLPAALRTTWTTRAIQRVYPDPAMHTQLASQGAAHGAVVMTSCQQRSKGRPCLVILLGMFAILKHRWS